MSARQDDQANEGYQHRSVLLDAAVDYLVTDENGRFVDATFGRGGHSRLILGKLGQVVSSWVLIKTRKLLPSPESWHLGIPGFSGTTARLPNWILRLNVRVGRRLMAC